MGVPKGPHGEGHSNLALVSTRASGIISAPLEEVWSVLRCFGSISEWLPCSDTMTLKSSLLPGCVEGQVGTKRWMELGPIGAEAGDRHVEELTCLDDSQHVLKYRVIDWPGSTNPWPYALIEFQSTFVLKEVTLGNVTFMDWSGSFETEVEGFNWMFAEFQKWMKEAVISMDKFLTARRRQQLAMQVPMEISMSSASVLSGSQRATSQNLRNNSNSDQREWRGSYDY